MKTLTATFTYATAMDARIGYERLLAVVGLEAAESYLMAFEDLFGLEKIRDLFDTKGSDPKARIELMNEAIAAYPDARLKHRAGDSALALPVAANT